MYPLFETIRLEDGVFFNLNYHRQRMMKSAVELFNLPLDFNLYEIIRNLNYPLDGLHKCKVQYNNSSYDISFLPYVIKPIDTLVPIEDMSIDYHLKLTDRVLLNEIGKQLKNNEEVIILKNGMVTDTRYTNLICRKNKQWFTPRLPLLKGTQREYLLNQDILIERDISLSELKKYDEVALINAMIPFERRIVINELRSKKAID